MWQVLHNPWSPAALFTRVHGVCTQPENHHVCNSSGNCTQTLYTRVFTRGFSPFTSEVEAPTELHPTFTTVCSPSAQLVHHQHSLFTTGCSPKAFVHQRRLFTRFSESNCNTGVIRHIGSLVSSVKEGGAGGTVGGGLVSKPLLSHSTVDAVALSVVQRSNGGAEKQTATCATDRQTIW